MKPIMFYDTETTGLIDFPNPSEGEQQPHLVQLAAKLVNLDDRQVIFEINTLVIPEDDWEWDETNEAFQVHGITVERCRAEGAPEVEAGLAFFHMWERGQKLDPDIIRIAHNETFDRRIIRIVTKRYPVLAQFTDPWHDVPKNRSYCTMWRSKKAFGLKDKPHLVDIYKQVTGKEHANAHDAMGDVDACLAVFWAIQDRINSTNGGDDE